jgi:phosphate transport system substrate-binding protein
MKSSLTTQVVFVLAISMAFFVLEGCPKSPDSEAGINSSASSGAAKAPDVQKSTLSGAISIDGSSTVYPITEAVAEEFGKANPNVRVTVGIAGTGGGFKKFGAGETDVSDASRPIKASEAEICAKGGVEYIELPVAFDGLSVVINPANDWCDRLTVDELHKIWMPDSKVKKWSDVRAGWPDKPITLYGPGTDSGTFDYFTEAVNGKSGNCRPDFTASEDDNVLVQGVSGDANSLGFFGYAYYYENKNKLKVVPIDGGSGPVEPSATTINNGTYEPLSRPLFIYVKSSSLDREEVGAFIKFYIENAAELASEVGFVALPDEAYKLVMARFTSKKIGSVFGAEGAQVGLKIEDLLKKEQ